MLRSALLLAVWALLGVPAFLVAVPIALLRRDGATLYRVGAAVGRIGLNVAGIRMHATFAQPLPLDTPCLFLANHASILDPPVLAAVLAPRRVVMLVKRELTRIPLFGIGMRAAGFIPVSRSGRVEDARQAIAQAGTSFGAGISVAIFPEGTRSKDGKLLPLKNGPFFLAMHAGAPVVPVTIRGTHHLLPKSSLRLRRGQVEVIVHAPLDPRDFASREALREAVRDRITSAL